MKIDPFLNSESLTRWVAQILTDRQLGELKNWRMLEYWMQVEIYHAVEKGQAGNWRHLGYYEQPYYTSTPLSGSKTNIKWVDLVFVSPNLEKPKRIIWIELKDLGRSTDRIISNAKVLGHDLAALYHLNTVETKRVWMTPPPHVVDKGRKQEWHELAPSLDAERHSICQIILAPEMLVQEVGKELINQSWLKTFERRAGVSNSDFRITMSDSIADGFVIFALVAPLPVNQAN